MKAYELYQRDQVNGDEFARDGGRERRQYYLELRQTLRDECASGRPCELVEALGVRMDKGKLPHMYLLDAAAVWECYENAIEGSHFLRDIGPGLPFPIGGRMLKWSEVQRMAGEGTLPVAVVDAELRERLGALRRFCAGRGHAKAKTAVNLRATLQTAAPCEAAMPETSGRKESGTSAPADGKATGPNRQLEALRTENAALRSQLEQLQQYRETTREHAIRAAESILAGKNEEARAFASDLEETLQAAVQGLEKTAADCRALEERIAQAKEQLEADRTQFSALRQQEQEAKQRAAAARSEREQAQRDATRAVQEQQAAQAELDAASARLNTELQTLRALRRKACAAQEACTLTQRQIEGLS